MIGQTLAMEGMFAFFPGVGIPRIVPLRRKRLSPKAHWWSAFAVFVGSWLSGYFIIATDAFMQHPVGYSTAADGSLQLESFWKFVLNPWAWMAVCAQHVRGGHHRRFHHDCGRAFYLL